jgi:hypothetical protein
MKLSISHILCSLMLYVCCISITPVAGSNIQPNIGPNISSKVTNSSNIQSTSKDCSNLKQCLIEAKASLDSGQLNEARGYATQAIQLDPRSQEAYILLGTALVKLSKWSDSRIAFEKAIQINPSTPEGKEAQKFLDSFKNPISVTFLPFDEGDIEVKIDPMQNGIDPKLVKRAELELKRQCRNTVNTMADAMRNSGRYKVRRENKNRRDIGRIMEDYTKTANYKKGIEGSSGSDFTKLYINCESVNLSCVGTKDLVYDQKDRSKKSILFNITETFNIAVYSARTLKLVKRFTKSYQISKFPMIRATLNNQRLNYSFQLNDFKDLFKEIYGKLFYDINTLLI